MLYDYLECVQSLFIDSAISFYYFDSLNRSSIMVYFPLFHPKTEFYFNCSVWWFSFFIYVFFTVFTCQQMISIYYKKSFHRCIFCSHSLMHYVFFFLLFLLQDNAFHSLKILSLFNVKLVCSTHLSISMVFTSICFYFVFTRVYNWKTIV